jgi:hypothetical protein
VDSARPHPARAHATSGGDAMPGGRIRGQFHEPALSPGTVSSYARRLADAGTTMTKSATPGQGSRPLPCALPDMPLSVPVAVIRWHGAPAVLVVRRATRTAQVLACAAASRVLYTTDY